MSDTPPVEPRLREHPRSRFEGDVHSFNLKTAVQKLRSEPHPAPRGHRQIAIYHYGALTKVLFAFDQGSVLEEHSANGIVSIHVLRGHLAVGAEGETHNLKDDEVLIMAPNVPHDVRAVEESEMLLSVYLQGRKNEESPRRDPKDDTTEKRPS